MFWRTEGDTEYNEVSMDAGWTTCGTQPFPPKLKERVVQYYIEGTSVSGKAQDRPMPAPEGYWQFRVGEVQINGLDESNGFAGFQPAFPNPGFGHHLHPCGAESIGLRALGHA